MEDESDDELTTASLELVGFVEKRFEGFTARAGFHQRLVVGAFFCRAASLLRTIDLLRVHEAAGAGILVRSVTEADLLLLYVALGGEEELNKVVGEFRRNIENLTERNPGARYSDEEPEWAFEKDRMYIETVARDVGPLLAKSGDKSGDATGIYDSIYRATSTFDAHGIGMTATHMDSNNDEIWKVFVEPTDVGISAARCLHLGAYYTAWVGQHAFRTLHFDPKPMVDFTARLGSAMDAALAPEEV